MAPRLFFSVFLVDRSISLNVTHTLKKGINGINCTVFVNKNIKGKRNRTCPPLNACVDPWIRLADAAPSGRESPRRGLSPKSLALPGTSVPISAAVSFSIRTDCSSSICSALVEYARLGVSLMPSS